MEYEIKLIELLIKSNSNSLQILTKITIKPYLHSLLIMNFLIDNK